MPWPGREGRAPPEPRFSRAEAMRTPAFWLLSLYTVLVYPVQAGVSLHQAAHLIERGLAPIAAATVISVFSAMSAVSGFGVGFLPRRWPLRYAMAAPAAGDDVGCFGLIGVTTVARSAYLAAGLFGLGIGGMMTLLPVAWADYFGRESFGAIRGVALSVQTAGAGGRSVDVRRVARLERQLHCRSPVRLLAALRCLAALLAQRPSVAG